MERKFRELQDPIHVRSINRYARRIQNTFNGVIEELLEGAPNANYRRSGTEHKQVGFKIGIASVIASSWVHRTGLPPDYELTIMTPIIIDNPEPDIMDIVHPLSPHEIVTFTSDNYHRSLDIEVKAVTKLGDFGRRVNISEYTAGGLLPPITTEGRGKLRAFTSVSALLRGVVPQDPAYLQPISELGIPESWKVAAQ